MEEESYNLEEELEASDLREYINNLIETLPERQQEIFKLSRNHQLTYKEIAAQLNISEKIVEHNISNTLKFLKKNLQLYTLFFAWNEINTHLTSRTTFIKKNSPCQIFTNNKSGKGNITKMPQSIQHIISKVPMPPWYDG